MVAIQAIRKSNARISELPEGLIALFIGATSGIGQQAMIQFAGNTRKPRIYFAARKASAQANLLKELKEKNSEGSYTIIEKDVSLIRDTNDVIDFVKSRESKLDLLFLSAGFISFDGRKETAEGLDPSMTTRYYSRLRATQGLLPLLNAAEHPRVVSILAGGQEAKLNEDDLDLRKPGNYSIVGAAVHSATMGTLNFERLAKENPKISFVHAYPGMVATPTFSRGSSGIAKILLTWILQPIVNLVATSPKDAGARALFYATSDRYSVNGGSVPLIEGVEKSPKSEGGIFLSNEKSETSHQASEKVLADFRKRGIDEKTWNHTLEIFDACGARA